MLEALKQFCYVILMVYANSLLLFLEWAELLRNLGSFLRRWG